MPRILVLVAGAVLSLAALATPTIEMQTSMGKIVIDLDSEKAPRSVQNFLQYVNEGFYNGTVFHRVIPDFMIQGGGFTVDMEQKPAPRKVENEARSGLKNDRGTLAMARTADPNSASSQFFINHRDNASLNYPSPDGAGYAVSARSRRVWTWSTESPRWRPATAPCTRTFLLSRSSSSPSRSSLTRRKENHDQAAHQFWRYRY